jgi:hypothetical protein
MSFSWGPARKFGFKEVEDVRNVVTVVWSQICYSLMSKSSSKNNESSFLLIIIVNYPNTTIKYVFNFK